MRLTFLYGTAASGKLSIARLLSQASGEALFHNHLVVDAVAAVFPFGSPEFARLREAWWLEMFGSAARAERSTIFTFMPEPSVAKDFPLRARALVEAAGGSVRFVRLTVDAEEQERRIEAPDRATFGKLRDMTLLRRLRQEWAAAESAMPEPALVIDTGRTTPAEAAALIAALS